MLLLIHDEYNFEQVKLVAYNYIYLYHMTLRISFVAIERFNDLWNIQFSTVCVVRQIVIKVCYDSL